MVKGIVLVMGILILGGCSVQKNNVKELIANNVITASRFHEYGYAPAASSSVRDKNSGIIYSKMEVCEYVGLIKKIDLLEIYQKSNFVAAKERAAFNDDLLRMNEYIAYKAELGSASDRAKANFLSLLEKRGEKIYKELRAEVNDQLGSTSDKMGISILLEAHDIPQEFDSCVDIEDVTDKVLRMLDSKH